MKLESVDIIEQPLVKVYETVRDDLPLLVPYMPNVSKIVLEEKTGNKLVNRWFAIADVPSMLKKVIKPELFSWVDRATWDDDKRRVTYVLESTLGKSLYDANGITEFRDLGDGRTELKVTCEVQLYPQNIPGVPKLLAKRLLPALESLMEKILAPNLTALAGGLQKYYKQN